jgi:hypothetical protein
MSLTKQGEFSKKVTDLTDVPSQNMPPSEIKTYFQTPPDELKATFNQLVDDLTTSGASKIGIDPVNGLSGSTIQDFVTSLKAITDGKTDVVGNHQGSWQGLTPQMIGAPEMNSARITAAETSLADIAINLKLCGCKLDGITDDSQAFVNACNDAKTKGYTLLLPKGTLFLNNTSLLNNLNLPPIKGVNKTKSVIVLGQTFKFLYDSGFNLSDVTINDSVSFANTDAISDRFVSNGNVQSISLSNVDWINTSALSIGDGSRRGGSFRGSISNLVAKHINMTGVRTGITVTGKSNQNLYFDNIHFFNTQTGFYISASEEWATNTESDSILDVKMSNISLINTQAQQLQYSAINGSDLFMFEYVKDALIDNVLCIRPCERTSYFNCCTNINVNNGITEYGEGWKFVGYVDSTQGINFIARGFKATNIRLDKGRDGADGYFQGFMLYECKDVDINGVYVDGGSDYTKPLFNAVLFIDRTIQNVTLKNIKANNLLRGLVYANWNAGSSPVTGTSISIDGLRISNVEVINPSLNTAPVINVPIPNLSGYIFHNIKLENIFARQIFTSSNVPIDAKGYSSTSPMKSLIEIDHIEKVVIKNNRIEGYSNPNGTVVIGSTSREIYMDEKMYVVTAFNVSNNLIPPSGSYATPSSKLTILRDERVRKGFASNEIYPLSNGSDDYATVDIFNNHDGYIRSSQYLDYDAEFYIPWNDTNGKIGKGEIYFDNGEYATFIIRNNTITLQSNSSLVTNVSTAGYLSIYKNPGYIDIRNRITGLTVFFNLSFKYTVHA